MYAYFFIFITALAGIIAMLVYRHSEIKKGVVSLPQESDAPLFSLEEFKPFYAPYISLHKENLRRSAWRASTHCVRIGGMCIRALRDSTAHRHARRVIDAVRGRQDIQVNTSASSFLQDIALHKQKVRGRKSAQ